MKYVWQNGTSTDPVWATVTNWQMTVTLIQGVSNQIIIIGYDRNANALATNSVTVYCQ